MRLQARLFQSKWMMEKKSFFSLCRLMSDNQVSQLAMDDNVAVSIPRAPEESDGDVAVISISGILTKGASEQEEQLLGLTNTDYIADALDNVASDPSVSKIVLKFSSPGGETSGIEELGRFIKYIDETVKPVYGWTEMHCASAAYWLMSQCRLLGMTPSSQVGSVGVYMLVLNTEEKMKMEGIKIDPISSGTYKLMGHEYITLKPEERKILEDDVTKQHEKFRNVIMAKRPQIQFDDLEGLSYEGSDALKKGYVDVVVDTMEEFLAKIN